MAAYRPLSPFRIPLTVDGIEIEIDGLRRTGTGTPLVFLHGFGSTKEDYADVVHEPTLATRPVFAYDAPGCGASWTSNPSRVDVPFLVAVAGAVLRAHDVDRFHVVGHSMGGLTALLLAGAAPERVASFVDIEGNLAPEDCFLSRQVLTHGSADPAAFLAEFAHRLQLSRYRSSALYAASLPHKVRAEAVAPIFRSMVDLSDREPLLDRFLALPAPRMFLYGEQNDTLSYLSKLAANGVELAPIPRCGHFPMYANAPAMWDRISRFVAPLE